MKKLWIASLLIMAIFLAVFAVVEAAGVALLTDPQPFMDRRGAAAAAVGVTLLTLDVFLPVPSSFVMIAHGALFGILAGTALSVLGSVTGAWLGFAVGRWARPLMGRLMSAEERSRAERLLARYGGLALIMSRPLPIIAETVTLLAGASPMSWSRLTLCVVLGVVPPAFLYAVTGATTRQLDNMLIVSGLVIGVGGLYWILARRRGFSD